MKSINIVIIILTVFSFNGYTQTRKPAKTSKPSPNTPSKPVEAKQIPVVSQEELKKIKEDSIKKAEDAFQEKQRLEKQRIDEEAIRKKEDEKRRYEETVRMEREENDRRQKEATIKLERENKEKFGVGLIVGRAYSSITTSEIGSINKVNLPAFSYGIFASIPIFKQIAILPEMRYVTKGLKYQYESDYDQLGMNYVSVPINVKIGLFVKPNYKLYIKAGGYCAYWLSGKNSNNVSGEKSNSKYIFDSDLTDGYKDNRIDYGALGGFGAELKIFGRKCFIEGRYDYGLSPIVKFESIPDDFKMPLNRSFGIWFGFITR
jgi:hypothetical protein